MRQMSTVGHGKSPRTIGKTTEVFPVIGKQFYDEVIKLLDNAKQSIYIIIYDWRWYPNNPNYETQKFNQAIIRAMKRGVKIKCIVNSYDIMNILKLNRCECKKLITGRLVHSKLILIDNNITVIGSHNFSQAAFTLNIETSAVIHSDEVAMEYIKFFDNLWQL